MQAFQFQFQSRTSEEQWDQIKTVVGNMYWRQNIPLRTVMPHLWSMGYNITEQQVRARCPNWGFLKRKRRIDDFVSNVPDVNLSDLDSMEFQTFDLNNTNNYSLSNQTQNQNKQYQEHVASLNMGLEAVQSIETTGDMIDTSQDLQEMNINFSHSLPGMHQSGVDFDSDSSTLRGSQQPLHHAARLGNLKMVESFLNKGVGPEVFDDDGVTPLWLAAQEGHFKTVELLSARGANVNVKNSRWDRAPLHQAVQNGHTRVARHLLLRNAEVDHADVDGQTPLWLAAQKGDIVIVEVLLAKGAKVDAADHKSERQAIHQAAQNGFEDIVELLLNNEADPNAVEEDGVSALWLACQQGHYRIVEMLHKAGAKLDAKARSSGRRPIHQAVQGGHVEIVKYLLDHGVSPDPAAQGGVTPLWLAVWKGYYTIGQALLARGAQPSAHLILSRKERVNEIAEEEEEEEKESEE